MATAARMTALKLFVSHSSRLDDREPPDADRDRNWRLLREVCDALKKEYASQIEILVDQHLTAGVDWNSELKRWLFECHAAIILCSRRAVEVSDWVKLEGAVLACRAALDPNFLLIPVTFRGETTAADLAQGYFGALEIHRRQCIEDADCAAGIVAGIKARFGEPATLAVRCGQTPLARLRRAAANLLSKAAADSIERALAAIDPGARPVDTTGVDPHALALACRLIDPQSENGHAAFAIFQACLHELKSQPTLRAEVWALFGYVRSLWVHPAAAAYLPLAQVKRRPVALRGRHLLATDPEERTPEPYTLTRFLERAWPETRAYKVVMLPTMPLDIQDVMNEIRAQVIPRVNRQRTSAAEQDSSLKEDRRTFIVAIPANVDGSSPIDDSLIPDLRRLLDDFERIVLVLALPPVEDDQPDAGLHPWCEPVDPPLDPRVENAAYLADGKLRQEITETFGSRQ